jgi:hypothetical protein
MINPFWKSCEFQFIQIRKMCNHRNIHGVLHTPLPRYLILLVGVVENQTQTLPFVMPELTIAANHGHLICNRLCYNNMAGGGEQNPTRKPFGWRKLGIAGTSWQKR